MRPFWIPEADWEASADLRSAFQTLSCVSQETHIFGFDLVWSYRPGLIVAKLVGANVQTNDRDYVPIERAQTSISVTRLACLGAKSEAAIRCITTQVRDLYFRVLNEELGTKLNTRK